jgi:hypothetical protein
MYPGQRVSNELLNFLLNHRHRCRRDPQFPSDPFELEPLPHVLRRANPRFIHDILGLIAFSEEDPPEY